MDLRSVIGVVSVLGCLAGTAPASEPAPPDAATAGQAGPAAAGSITPGWRTLPTGTQAQLRGLSPVNRRVAWVSGSQGTVLRTTDGGRSWQNVSPPDTADLEFRDIEAFDARTAVILSIGTGETSRIYRTENGGRTWTETFRNAEPTAFYDCVSFFDRRAGLAMSDPVDGRFRILSTDDGGRTWRVLPAGGMPEALPGEAGFAASGQCLVTAGRNDAWLAGGGAERSRVFHSADRGRTWTVSDTPIPAGDPARGVFALAFRDTRHGVAVGGDYRPGRPSPSAAAFTDDGGTTWHPATTPPPAYRSGVTWVPHLPGTAIAVGPTGSDITFTSGRHWHPIDTASFDTVSCTPDLTCWASGEQGGVGRLTLSRP